MIIDKFIGFIGKVVDVDGKDVNFGKVQIRVTGDQEENVIETSDLLWATVMTPTTSAAELGIGTTPNWMIVGTTVFGIFLDGKYRNIPIVLGAINQNKPIGHGISPLASGENIPRSFTEFENSLGVQNARKPNYKNNKVITTAAKETPSVINHIIELDDTQQAERILVKHKSGSYIEFLPNGSVVVKGMHTIGAVADKVKLRATDITIVADGDIDIKADNITLEASTINMNGNTNINGDFAVDGDNVTINAPRVTVIGAMTLNGRPVATT